MSSYIWFALICSVIAIAYGAFLAASIMKKPTGNDKMREIAAAIQAGAKAYLNRQYRTIAVIAVILFFVLWWKLGIVLALGFLVGAILSALAGYVRDARAVRKLDSPTRGTNLIAAPLH